jgi:hydrogenase nickel incorporation protein HypA/HybF
MHELGIAQEIVAIVADRAGPARMSRVVLEIGRHAIVLPDSIRFCIDLCGEGTVVEGARLEIHEIPGRAECRQCGALD